MTTKEVMEKYDKKYGFKAVIYYWLHCTSQ